MARLWRPLVALVLLGLWLAAGIGWGGAAFGVFGFFLALAVAFSTALRLWSAVLARSGTRYYEKLLNGPRR